MADPVAHPKQPVATETELLRAKIAKEQALAGLFNTLRDVALDIRNTIAIEVSKRNP